MKVETDVHANGQELEQLRQELRRILELQEKSTHSEDLYRTIFETAGTAIITIDSDTTIRLANSNFEKLSGYSKQELEGVMKWTVFIAPDDIERMKAHHERRRIDPLLAPSEYEFRFVNRTGQTRDILLNIAMIPGTSQSVASCMDITARKHVEEALRRSEENYRNILSTIQEVYYEVDLKGNFTFFNPMTWKALGYSEEELTKMNFRNFMDAHNIQKVFDAYHRVYITGEPEQAVEFEAIRANKEKLPAEASVSLRKDSSDRVIGFKGVVRDISARRESEMALRSSEERYRLLAENSSDVIWTLSLDGLLTYISPSIKAFSGYDPEELLGKGVDAILTPESSAFVKKTLTRELGNTSGKRGQAGQFELRHFTRDGTVKDIEVSTTWILNERKEPVGLQGSTRDVTGRRQAEEALRRSEEKYRNILESIQEGYFEVDLKGRFTFFNDSFCSMVGYLPDEVMGSSYTVFVDEETAGKIYDVFHNVFLTGRPDKGFDWYIVRKEGEKKAIESSVTLMRGPSGEPMGFRGVMRDVTERKKAQEALRLSEERFRDLAELLPETVYEADLDGRLTFVNKSGFERFGYSEADIAQGLQMRSVISPDDLPKMEDSLARMLKGEKTGLMEYTMVRKDGRTFPGLAHSAPIIRGGTPSGIRGFVVDVSDKKNLEARLLQARRMESIGTLAGGIAHDFNNLLMGILGNVSLIMMGMDETHVAYGRMKNVEEYVKRASDLTQQLLGFARGGKYDVRTTDLREFIGKSTDMFARTHREIRMHTLIPDELWPAEVDRSQMEQVMLNLYMNARQAMPSGGDLYVAAENTVLAGGSASAYELSPGKYVKITLRDTGVGMDQTTLSRIFEPFFTTREMGRGTGLGLASVYGIVKNHSGHIGVESELGVGTEFFIYLPASIESHERKGSASKDARKGSGFILLVDDEDMILDVGSAMIEGMGYRVMQARGGKAGLEMFLKHKTEIDLVILDMIMPDLPGRDVYTCMKQADPEVRVLLSSGYNMDEQAHEIMQSGCRGFIQKPFSIKDLSEKIREILE